MRAAEIKEMLFNYVGKRVQITFSDLVTQVVDIDSVDCEGFLHSRDGGGDPQDFWTRFEDVKTLVPLGSDG